MILGIVQMKHQWGGVAKIDGKVVGAATLATWQGPLFEAGGGWNGN
jgi:hypothetical protein